MKNLNPRQRRFVAEYLIDLNALQAARRAGYSEKSSSTGAKLLDRPEIAEAVAEGQAAQFKRLHMSADEVLAELAAVARARAYDVIGKPIAEWGVNERAALASYEEEVTDVEAADGKTLDDGKEMPPTLVTNKVRKVKFHDKTAALALLARKHALLKDKVEHEVGSTMADLVLRAARIRESEKKK